MRTWKPTVKHVHLIETDKTGGLGSRQRLLTYVAINAGRR